MRLTIPLFIFENLIQMRPIDLSKLRIFYEIARQGSLTRAAGKLNISQPALSRMLLTFEDRINTKLFERFSNGMRLTTQGERLYALAEKVINQVNSFERVFYEKEDEIEGEIKIITTPFFGSEWLVPSLDGFLQKYPEIRVKIFLTSDHIDLTQADVAICMHPPPHLIQKQLFSARIRLFASPSYLKKYGTPETPEDLDHHRLITYRGDQCTPYGWILNVGRRREEGTRECYLEINSLHGMLRSALNGQGIVELPDYSMILESGLIEILPNIRREDIPLYYVFLKTRESSKKIKLLFSYLSKKTK